MAEHNCFTTDLISYYNICNMYTHTTYPHLPTSFPLSPSSLSLFLPPLNYFIATQQLQIDAAD